jgi:hypothetical protein
MEQQKQLPDIEDDDSDDICANCPVKEKKPPIVMTKEEKAAMKEAHIRHWGPYGYSRHY